MAGELTHPFTTVSVPSGHWGHAHEAWDSCSEAAMKSPSPGARDGLLPPRAPDDAHGRAATDPGRPRSYTTVYMATAAPAAAAPTTVLLHVSSSVCVGSSRIGVPFAGSRA